jgi:hypothetical protein
MKQCVLRAAASACRYLVFWMLQEIITLVLTVCIAAGYGLGCPWIESRWGRDFPRPSRLAVGPSQVIRAGKAAGAWRGPPNPIYRRR